MPSLSDGTLKLIKRPSRLSDIGSTMLPLRPSFSPALCLCAFVVNVFLPPRGQKTGTGPVLINQVVSLPAAIVRGRRSQIALSNTRSGVVLLHLDDVMK